MTRSDVQADECENASESGGAAPDPFVGRGKTRSRPSVSQLVRIAVPRSKGLKLTSLLPSRTLETVRMSRMTRRLLGGALIAFVVATSAAPHNHPLGELLGGSVASGERAITTHDPHSRASHWHAVIRFVKEDPCLACQWHRLPGAPSQAAVASQVFSVSFGDHALPAVVRSGSLGRPSSRAPPTLL